MVLIGFPLARADDPVDITDPEANPARPTVSTPATLPPAGYLQFESGSLGAITSPEFSTRVGINNVTKLALNSRLELLVQTDELDFVPSDANAEPQPATREFVERCRLLRYQNRLALSEYQHPGCKADLLGAASEKPE